LRDTLLAATAVDDHAATALELLRGWDGTVDAGSAAASVYELAFEELVRRTIAAKAPNSARWARGVSADPVRGESDFVLRRMSHLVRLLREQPPGWVARPWSEEIGDALSAAVRTLRERRGDDPSEWAWGSVRPLTLVHPLAARAALARVFNIGPLPGWGDGSTVAQASLDPVNPLAKPLYIPMLRMNVDVGDWERSRFATCGGQSGNPVSPHYDDQVPAWQSGAGIPIAWSEESVAEATVTTLALRPER
jgi:penicillin G amidase